MLIRPATTADVPRLQDIERAAGLLFATVGMRQIAEDEPPSATELTGHVQAGTAWVASTASDPSAVAYLIADLIDGSVHVEQVSVHPDHAGRGIGRALIDHLATWATERGAGALTLTTFADVPWNAPYYQRLGFRVLPAAQLTPGLVEIRRREAAAGLDRWPRVCMRKYLPTAGPLS